MGEQRPKLHTATLGPPLLAAVEAVLFHEVIEAAAQIVLIGVLTVVLGKARKEIGVQCLLAEAISGQTLGDDHRVLGFGAGHARHHRARVPASPSV